ncbi:5-oxoprolinase subunit C family protein [Halopseudomonas salina]|uniref:Carboxyltransferase domain-containing protein n=1 Tax=Halopseudomonas salina TaxID=1323744 RepID=A0ABQ1PAJ9_9GAMM|nr:biotin-dependent carboxyltransferase family protein [Halopseudomonas salina]GGC93764.1 hypothetical protein GCM10007418_11620 [Halopseudomonas salina]
MSGLLVEHTLGLAQLQDRGRFGVRHIGVTQGGALDWVAAHWANHLLGNSPDCAVMEIPLGGLTLRCEQDSTLAITGADLAATLDGIPVYAWQSFAVQRGQQLTFNPPLSGVRGYLAAPGGFAAPQVLGSRSTVGREKLGGFGGEGQPLRPGDRLEFAGDVRPLVRVPEALLPDYSRPAVLELLPGSRLAGFSGRSLFDAFNRPWQVDPRADRMGVRLRGPVLRYQGASLVSEGIPLGAIQVPPDGQPIILLNDRQTIGGYPCIGTLTPESVARLAQCPVGAYLTFRAIGVEQAQRQHLELLNQFGAPLMPYRVEHLSFR